MSSQHCGHISSLLKAINRNALESLLVITSVVTEQMVETINNLNLVQSQVLSPKLHKAPAAITNRFILVNGFDDSKPEKCRQLLEKYRDRKTLIICNGAVSANLLHAHLIKTLPEDFGPRPGLLHNFVPEKQRSVLLDHFLQASRFLHKSGQKPTELVEGFIEPINHLVCTDLMARGIHNENITHVILYDFPKNLPEFIHRIGRAAGFEIGKECRTSALVVGADRRLAEYTRLIIRNKQRFGEPLPQPTTLDKSE